MSRFSLVHIFIFIYQKRKGIKMRMRHQKLGDSKMRPRAISLRWSYKKITFHQAFEWVWQMNEIHDLLTQWWNVWSSPTTSSTTSWFSLVHVFIFIYEKRKEIQIKKRRQKIIWGRRQSQPEVSIWVQYNSFFTVELFERISLCTNEFKYANLEWWYSHLMKDHPLFFLFIYQKI